MSYITIPEDPDKQEEPKSLKYSKEVYKGATVDSRLENISTISSYISGSKWKVDYYRQILGRDDAASTHSDKSYKVHKQYTLIRGVPIIVSQELQASQNSDGQRSFEMTGSGSVIYDITPIEGDVIIADIGDGREMEFTVTTTERVSIYPEAYVDISYRAVRVVDANVRESIDSKVKEELYYSVDNQRIGLKSLLTRSEAEDKNRLRQLYNNIVRRYIRDFLSDEYGTLIVPGQGCKAYDPYITRFFKSIIDSSVFPELHEVNILNTHGDELAEDETLWDCILNVDLTSLPVISSKATFFPVSEFKSRPLFNSIYFSGVEKVLRVVDPGYSVNLCDGFSNTLNPLVKAGTQTDDLIDLVPVKNLNDEKLEYTDIKNDTLPMINRIVSDNYYVFSGTFYEKKVPTSILERLLIDRVEKGIMDNSKLAKIAEYSFRFDNLERFYYTPIILALIKLSDGVI